MKAFAKLFSDLDETNKTNEKVRILKEYFSSVTDRDKIQTLALFTGRKPKRQINATFVRNWAMEMAKIPHGCLKKATRWLAISAKPLHYCCLAILRSSTNLSANGSMK